MRESMDAGIQPINAWDLPWTEMASMLTTAGVGIVLWAAGGWLLRPAVASLGLGLGALGGLLIWMETGIGPPWAAPLIGGVLLACVAVLAYRLLAGALLSIVLALFMASAAWMTMNIIEPPVPPPPTQHLFGWPDAPANENVSITPVSTATLPTLRPPVAESDVTKWRDAYERTRPFMEAWALVNGDSRLCIMIAGGAGLLAGFVLATVMPTLAAILLTAITGSAMVLIAAPRLASQWDLHWQWMTGPDAGMNAAWIWLCAGACGLIAQQFTRPQAQRSGSKSG